MADSGGQSSAPLAAHPWTPAAEQVGSRVAHRAQLIERYHLAATAVAVPVGHHVVGDPIEPGREGEPTLDKAGQVMEGLVKDFGGEVLGVVVVAGPVVDIAIDLLTYRS